MLKVKSLVFSVNLEAEPVEGEAPLTVRFSGTIADYVGSLEWLLNFGDGNVEWGKPPAPSSFTVEHTYGTPGAYEAVLGAHDSVGHQDFSRVNITVAQPVPPPTEIPWVQLAPLAMGTLILGLGLMSR
ncbi:MAG: PKD domain-containing protein [Candidatus Freyarchaeota archaeon]